MANDLAMASMWVTLVPVVVGGVLAAGAGATTQWLMHRARVSEERRSKRAAKFEELVQAVYEFDHWIKVARNIRVYGAQLEEKPSPLAKVEAITAVYFPTFMDRIKELELASDKYELWMLDRGQARLRNDLVNLNEGGIEAAKDYLKVKARLLNELRELMSREV